MTLIALPLFKLELSFLVRRGRRWTALEQLIIWAAAERPRDLAGLCAASRMPERLVAECLVNLLKVGWLEIAAAEGGAAGSVSFAANARGRSVACLDELPYAFDIEKRFAALYVDRLTASVLDEEQLKIRHIDQVDRSTTIVLGAEREKYDASPALFYESLALRPEECFERPLAHRVMSLAQFAIVEAIGSRVTGLPADAPARLAEAIVARLPRKHWAQPDSLPATGGDAERPLTSRPSFRASAVTPEDILIGGRSHRLELKRMLADARSAVFVHSTFIGGMIEAFIPDFVNAAEREVDVFLLWGERRDPLTEEPNQSEMKGRLGYSRIPVEWRDRIRLAKDPTGSHAKVLLADSGPDGSFEAVVGSCNWLSADYTALEVSVRLKDPALVQEVAGLLADLSRSPSGAWGRDVHTLLRIQDACRRRAAAAPPPGPGGAKAMLVFDDEHYAAVREARNSSASSAEVGCDLFGSAAETSVFVPLGMLAEEDGASVQVFYNRPTEAFASELDESIGRFASREVAIRHCPRLHGKFLAWNDETIAITSFNWLSASLGAGNRRGSEVGILIRDRGLVRGFFDRMSAATGITFKG